MTSTNRNGSKFVFKGFINLEFTSEDKNTFSSLLERDGPDLEDSIVTLIESGYKLGFSYDDYHGVNQVALTCKDHASMYFGFCFTFKHASPARSAFACRWFYDTYLKPELYPLPDVKSKYDW